MSTTVVMNGQLGNVQLAQLLKQQLGTKYSVETDPRGRGVKVISSSTKAAYTRIRPDKDTGASKVQIWGQVPSAGARLLALIPFAIPLLYMQLVGARPVVDDVREALERRRDNAA